jgi:CBS domain-containing protein/anti-sigma regulatory factor (Ser/Thr protein kinase)
LDESPKATKIQELVYELKVGEVMTRKVITVTPQTLMSELRDILREHRISGTPVVESDSLVGLISIEDFIKWLGDREDDCPIEQKMTRNVRTLYPEEPLVQAVNKLGEHGYGRMPVVERRTNKLVGIVTNGDIIEGLLKKLEVDYHEEEIHRYRASHIFEDIVADKTALFFQYDVQPRNFDRAGEASSRLKTTLKRLGVDPQIVRRIAIASYEAEMNLIIYSEGGRITVRVYPNRIVMEVRDTGPGIEDVEKAMEPGYSTAPEWVRELGFGAGMGLANIKKCSDEMEITSTMGQGTRIRFSIRSEPEDEVE